jgi:transcriptional regulator with XRE-family HTH domain
MVIGDRLRAMREGRNLSQGDIEERTGMLRCYISRVENGHTVPYLETLEKFARAMDVPLYHLVYDGEKPPKLSSSLESQDAKAWGSTGKDARVLHQLRRLLSRTTASDRNLLLFMAEKMARQKNGRRNT